MSRPVGFTWSGGGFTRPFALVVAAFACLTTAVLTVGPLGSAQASESHLVAKSISAGDSYTCAIRVSGQAVCWGYNRNGQLGDGTTQNRLLPTPVQGLTDARSISAGTFHTCAIRTSGQAVCWGHNGIGQLGDGTTQNRLVPTPVQGLNDASSISAGEGHSCAIRESGQAVCWGYNGYGKLGDGSTEDRLVPTPVQGLNDARWISAGFFHSCAVRESGQAVCWGYNGSGELGDDTYQNRFVPTPVHELTDAMSITAFQDSTCAVRESGQAVCWGYNGAGQLGDGTTEDRWVPTPVQGLTDATSISTGYSHSCALRESGQVVCWGGNGAGQLGDGTTQNRLTSTSVLFEVFELTVEQDGSGSGSVSVDWEGPYGWGDEVTLTASPDEGSSVAWDGCDSTDGNECTVTMEGDRTVTATFDLIPPDEFMLTVNKPGNGSGSVSADPEPVGGTYTDGTVVTLTATPDAGSTFEGWTGCDSTDGNDCVVTMDGDRTVSVEFALIPEPTAPFHLVLNHGLASLGSVATDSVVTGTVTLDGTLNPDTGQVTVPSENVSDITADLPGVDGSVTFRPNGTHLAGELTANGRVTLRGPFRASFTIGDLSCHATQNFQFSTDRTVPYRGTRFASGLEGQGAIVAAWDTLGGIRGDVGCSDLNGSLTTPGAVWLSHDIASPFPPAPVGPIELTPPTLIDSSGAVATQITPGRRLICVAGTWSNVTRGTFAWTKNDAPFSNLKADGAGSDVYRPTAGDIGSTFSCHQVMRNAQVTGVVGTSSNTAVVVAN